MKRFRAVLVLALIASCVPVRSQIPAPTPASQQPSQTLALPGLRDRVTVRRDERGIPYIEAANDEDVYFAQGYVIASDRLWQMDLLRRTVRGELSEIFGQATLAQDKTHRLYNFAGVLDQAVTRLPPKLSVALNAYANGVNAFIDSLNDQTLPPEFRILQYKPRHWTASDSLSIGKLLAEYLSSTWQLDVMRAALAGLPKEKREMLLPETTPLDVLVVGKDRPPAKAQNHNRSKPISVSPDVLKQLAAAACGSGTGVPPVNHAQDARATFKQHQYRLASSLENEQQALERLGLYLQDLETLQASNNWVVSGKRTVSGKPLLANDPHIPGAAPGIWYQVELMAPGLHVAGVTFPGAPGIVLGHNERIAWGATNLGPDVQDVYLEKFDKDNPSRYQTPSGWRDAEVRHEQIKVRQSFTDPRVETHIFDVTVTRHGPIVLEKEGARYALRWTSLDPEAVESAVFVEVNRAKNWKEFSDVLSRYGGPTQNFIYADVDGHIGYYAAGRIPVRKSGDGSTPYDGSTDDGEWTGYIPFESLPHVYDPPSGMIVTANQRVVGQDYPQFLSHVWAQPYRARRIFDLLSEKPKLTIDDFRRIQGDVYSIGNVTFARAAAKILRAGRTAAAGRTATAGSAGILPASLISDFENWDGKMAADSKVAVVVAQMRSAFRLRILNAALGADLAKTYVWPQSDAWIHRIITDQPRDWLPKEFTSYAELLRASYEDARQALTKNLGADESKWTWGNQTKSRFPHPLAQAPLIGLQFTIEPIPQNGTGGSGATVNVGAAVSMRLIADTSDWDKTLNGIPLGQSGLPNSPHWRDQLDDWRNVTPRAFPFSKPAVESATKEMVILEPK